MVAPPFSRTINTDLPHGAALNREDMAIPLAWKIVAVALAKKATLYALGRVSCPANRAKHSCYSLVFSWLLEGPRGLGTCTSIYLYSSRHSLRPHVVFKVCMHLIAGLYIMFYRIMSKKIVKS